MAKTDREKAQEIVIKLKKQLKKNHEIAAMAGVHESIISRLYTGNSNVHKKAIDAVLEIGVRK